MLQRCVGTDGIWSLGDDFVLSFTCAACQLGCGSLEVQDLPGGTKRRNTMTSERQSQFGDLRQCYGDFMCRRTTESRR